MRVGISRWQLFNDGVEKVSHIISVGLVVEILDCPSILGGGIDDRVFKLIVVGLKITE